ncbi:MAG: hypothetical protein WC552_08410 [Candidatus Omnitrophota bacterium]
MEAEKTPEDKRPAQDPASEQKPDEKSEQSPSKEGLPPEAPQEGHPALAGPHAILNKLEKVETSPSGQTPEDKPGETMDQSAESSDPQPPETTTIPQNETSPDAVAKNIDQDLPPVPDELISEAMKKLDDIIKEFKAKGKV